MTFTPQITLHLTEMKVVLGGTEVTIRYHPTEADWQGDPQKEWWWVAYESENLQRRCWSHDEAVEVAKEWAKVLERARRLRERARVIVFSLSLPVQQC